MTQPGAGRRRRPPPPPSLPGMPPCWGWTAWAPTPGGRAAAVTRLAHPSSLCDSARPPILPVLQSRLLSGICHVGGTGSLAGPAPVTWTRPCHPQKASCSQIPWGCGARAGRRPSGLWLPGLGTRPTPPFFLPPCPSPGPALPSPGFPGSWLSWQAHPRSGVGSPCAQCKDDKLEVGGIARRTE